MKSKVFFAIFRCFSLALSLWSASLVHAQTYGSYKDLKDFGYSVINLNGSIEKDGVSQYPVVFDAAGDMFGTDTNTGGSGGELVWEITKAGRYLDIHDFGGPITIANGSSGYDGFQPAGRLTLDNAGNLYGTTWMGGGSTIPGGSGMVWEITTSGLYKDLHDFGETIVNSNGQSGPDGMSCFSGVTFDKMGNMFGTTALGGANAQSTYSNGGIIWELTKTSEYKDLHDFGGTARTINGDRVQDGWYPATQVKIDSEGNLYGTATFGGANALYVGGSAGMVWEFTASGMYIDLHDFGAFKVARADGTTGPDGTNPGELVISPSGTICGTAMLGGGGVGFVSEGMIWTVTSSGSYTDIHDFGGTIINSSGIVGPDGSSPSSYLAFDKSGNLYGTTQYGGAYAQHNGIVWELALSGGYSDLHDFGGTIINWNGASGPDGQVPQGGVTFDSVGNLYGVTPQGGPLNLGNLWELPLGNRIDAVSVAVLGDGDTRLLWNVHGTADVWRIKSNRTVAKAVHYGPFVGWTPRQLSANMSNGTALLWSSIDGAQDIWQLDENANYISDNTYGPFPGWNISAIGAGGSDGNSRLLWTSGSTADVWVTNSKGHITDHIFTLPQYDSPIGFGVAADNSSRLLWSFVDGSIGIWKLNSDATVAGTVDYGPFPGWAPTGLAVAPDGTSRLTWTYATGEEDIWKLDASCNFVADAKFGPYSYYVSPTLSALAPDDTNRLLWIRNDGLANLWSTDSVSGQSVLSSVDFGPF